MLAARQPYLDASRGIRVPGDDGQSELLRGSTIYTTYITGAASAQTRLYLIKYDKKEWDTPWYSSCCLRTAFSNAFLLYGECYVCGVFLCAGIAAFCQGPRFYGVLLLQQRPVSCCSRSGAKRGLAIKKHIASTLLYILWLWMAHFMVGWHRSSWY